MSDAEKPPVDADGIQNRVNAIFGVFDGVFGTVRQRMGMDPTPIRMRRQQQPSGHNTNPGLFGNIIGRFGFLRQDNNGQPIQQQEVPEEGSLDYWRMQLEQHMIRKPKYMGTKEYRQWDRRRMEIQSKIDRIENPARYLRGASIAGHKPRTRLRSSLNNQEDENHD